MDIDKMVEKVAEAVSAYGPKVGELAMQTAQLAAIRDLIVGGLWLLMGVVLAVVAVWLMRLASRLAPETDKYGYMKNEAEVAFSVFGAFASAVVAIMFTLATIFRLTNPILWASISNPEVYLAAKALGWL